MRKAAEKEGNHSILLEREGGREGGRVMEWPERVRAGEEEDPEARQGSFSTSHADGSFSHKVGTFLTNYS